MDKHLPAEQLAHELLTILAQNDITVDALAQGLGVHADWLDKLLTGQITELTLLTVVGLCKRLRIMPEDIWDPGLAARAFWGFPANTFDPDDAA